MEGVGQRNVRTLVISVRLRTIPLTLAQEAQRRSYQYEQHLILYGGTRLSARCTGLVARIRLERSCWFQVLHAMSDLVTAGYGLP